MTGTTIRERRKAIGLSQAELAMILGLHKKSIQRWELGYRELPPKRAAVVELVLSTHEQAKKRVSRELANLVASPS